MAGGLASAIALSCVSAMIGKTSFSAFSIANDAKLKLVTSTGTTDETGDGTEVSGGSYPAGGISMTISSTFGAAAYSSGVASVTNSGAAVSQTNMPAATTAYAVIYDGTATPVRWWWGPLSSNVTTNSGDTLTFDTSSITVELNV